MKTRTRCDTIPCKRRAEFQIITRTQDNKPWKDCVCCAAHVKLVVDFIKENHLGLRFIEIRNITRLEVDAAIKEATRRFGPFAS